MASAVVRRGRREIIAAAALTAACALAAALPAAAQERTPDAAELGLDVAVGFDGRVPAGAWLPVTVTLDPARPVDGALVLESRSVSGVAREQRRVEVAARARSVYRFVVPAGPITVTVQEQARDPVTVRPPVEPDAGVVLAGVLGGVPDGVPSLRHGPTGLPVAWVGVDAAWLAVSPAALDALDVLVAGQRALDGLSDDDRRAVAAGVVAGTDVVVVADREGAVEVAPGLPVPADAVGAPGALLLAPRDDAWAVGAGDGAVAAAVLAGRGRVTAVAAQPGQAAAGGSGPPWANLVEPRERDRGAGWPADRSPHQFARVFDDPAAAPPALPWLAAFALAYVVVVGPVNGLVLSRLGRRELAWATVPAVTVVFTVAAFVGVAGSRPPVGDAARVLATIDGATVELVAAQVRAPTEGERTIHVDGDGWAARPLVDGGQAATLQRGSGLTATFSLRALQPGGLIARRAAADPPPLEIEARQDAGGAVLVTVTNAGPAPLEEVTVTGGGTTARIGSLAPGATDEADVGGAGLPVVDPWGDPLGDLPLAAPGSLGALLQSDLLDGSPGAVWVTGVLRSGGTSAAVTVDGEPARDRGVLLAAGTTVRLAGGPPGPLAVQRIAVAPGARGASGPHMVEGASEAFLRFRLPAGGALEVVSLDLERGRAQPALEVWLPEPGEWHGLDTALPGRRGTPAALLDPLGTLWVRATGDLHPFDFSARSVHGVAP